MAILEKLFFLAVRQLSKPIAGAVKSAAVSSEGFSAVLASVGQRMHRLRIQVNRVAEGKLALGKVSPLSDARAVASGAELLSETVIYTTAAATIVYEMGKSKAKEQDKERLEEVNEMRRREESRVNEQRQWDQFRHLEQRITLMQEELQRLRRDEAEAAKAAKIASERRQGWLW